MLICAALIDDLERASPEFRAWWPRHDVRGSLDCRKELPHPLVGSLALDRTTLQLAARPDLKIMIYTPAESETAQKLRCLLERPPAEVCVAPATPAITI
jgi:hypothetical protein